jgi:hypothetical protein
MDMPTWGYPPSDNRVSDAERDQAIARLSGHFQAGRLTLEEFEDRSGRALQARTTNELSVLFLGLPENTVFVPPGPAPGAGSVPPFPRPWAGAPSRLSPGNIRGAGRRPARGVILGVIAAIILVGVLSHAHAGLLGWLVLVVIARGRHLAPRSPQPLTTS